MSILIYFILYSLLPSFYHKYKIDSLQESVEFLSKESQKIDLETLKEELFYLRKKHNLTVTLRSQDGRIIYGENDFLIKSSSYFFKNSINDEYNIQMMLYTKDSLYPYFLNITMPLQPIDEAKEVIKKLMPAILILCILIGIIGAYIYLNAITKPLVEIIEKEREAENRRKDFIATISHELKTPITIISGQVEGMIYNIGKFKDRDTYLKKSYDSIQELKKLVDEMVEVSKSEILVTDLRYENINFSELVEKLIKRQSFLIEEKNLNLNTNISKDIFVKCDVERIEKAISNIINNAIKYSPENENLLVNLYKKSTRSNIINSSEKVYLTIENTGVTIDEKDIKQIFEPFFRIEKSRSRKTGGSGLGLYLTSQILKSHGYAHFIKNKKNSVIFEIEIKL